MKIAIVTDTHFGVRGNHQGFLDYFERFYDEIFFPTLKRYNINKILHLGDLVDNRNSLNYYTAHKLRNCFLDRLATYDVHFIVGNHDTFHKNTNEINAYEIVKPYGNIHVHQDPIVYNYHGRQVLFLPWINNENYDISMELIENVRLDYCFGHLELSGHQMSMTTVANQGISPTLFNNFSSVFSGHYHHKSTRNNIHYLGAPYEMTWADYNDAKGFHIFDFDTGELEFIENPYIMYHMIHYSDDKIESLLKSDLTIYNKKYIKIIVKDTIDTTWLDSFLDALDIIDPYNIQVISNSTYLQNTSPIDVLNNTQDTLSILNQSVDDLPDVVDKKLLKVYLQEIYDEANLINDNI